METNREREIAALPEISKTKEFPFIEVIPLWLAYGFNTLCALLSTLCGGAVIRR